MDPYIGEIRMFAGGFAPKYWAFCDGQLLPISQNTALFSVMGTAQGGDGKVYFGLPDLRRRVPIGAGAGASGISNRFVGDSEGSESVTLTTDNLPAHIHGVFTNTSPATSNDPAGKTFGTPFSGDNLYSTSANLNTPLSGVVGNVGGGQPHNNMQPYLAVNFIIALAGVYPPRF